MKGAEAVGFLDLARAHDEQDDGRATTDSHRTKIRENPCKSVAIVALPVHFHRELELARIIRGGRSSGIGK